MHNEINDHAEYGSSTKAPETLTSKKNSINKNKSETGIDTYEDELDQPDKPKDKQTHKKQFGMTPADLISAFHDNPKFITMFLFLLPIAIFITKIDIMKFESLKMPVLLGAGLNVVWHGITFLQWIKKKLNWRWLK